MIIANITQDVWQYGLGAVAMIVVLYFALRLRRKIQEDQVREKLEREEWERIQAEKAREYDDPE